MTHTTIDVNDFGIDHDTIMQQKESLRELRKHLERQINNIRNQKGNPAPVQEELEAVNFAARHLELPLPWRDPTTGDMLWPVMLTYEHIDEIMMLIDDEPVDEEVLADVRKRLKNKKKKIRQSKAKYDG